MSNYGPNLIVNSDAHNNLSDWESQNVTIEDGITEAIVLKPQLGDSYNSLCGNWFAHITPQLSLTGLDGTKHFNIAPDGYIKQVIPASAIGDLPDYDFKLVLDFKLSLPQELEDSSVIGWAEATVLYSDKTTDIYLIPCVVGLVTLDRVS